MEQSYNMLFEKNDVWKKYNNGNIIRDKWPLIKSLIADDVKTVIDVGCGNGILTNKLGEYYDTTGLDRSEKALKYVSTKKVKADMTEIPFPDNEFDFVLSSEVLEHIPESLLDKAISELFRISKKYVLITVPNNEYLLQSFVKCSNCGNQFHPYGHLNSYNIDSITDLVRQHGNSVKNFVDGPLKQDYNPMLLKLKNFSGVYFDVHHGNTICDKCENTSFINSSNIISKGCNFLNRILSRRRPYWLFTLFIKTKILK